MNRLLALVLLLLACVTAGCSSDTPSGKAQTADPTPAVSTDTTSQSTTPTEAVQPAPAPTESAAQPTSPTERIKADKSLTLDDPPASAPAQPVAQPKTLPGAKSSCPDRLSPGPRPSTGTSFERFKNDPFYDNTQLIKIGTAKPRPGNAGDAATHLQRWCAQVRTGVSADTLYEKLGMPNIRVGIYSVWEAGSTRTFAEFDESGKLTAWLS